MSKLDDLLKRLDAHIDEYLAALEESDGKENDRKFTREELEEKLAKLQERKARYEGFLKELEESGAGQMSLTDPDAKLMKENNGFGVGYNAQTAVDADSHLIAGFEITNHPTVVKRHRETTDSEVAKMSLQEMIAKAHEGYFVRDAERNMVICPQGEILRPKSVKKNGNIRYCNKLACKRCKAKCTTAKFKEADFSKDCLSKKVGKPPVKHVLQFCSISCD